MKRRYAAAAVLAAAVAFTAFLKAPPAAAMETAGGVHGELAVKKYGAEEGRKYELNFTAWGKAEVQSEPGRVILCLDVSDSMGWLSDSPPAEESFHAGVAYPVKDSGLTGEETDLYGLVQDEYKPVRLREDTWYSTAYDSQGRLSYETPVGKKTEKEGEAFFEFSTEIVRKGECRTRLEYLKEGCAAFLDRLSEANPENKAGLVYSSGDFMELSSLTKENLRRLKASLSGSDRLQRKACSEAEVLEQAEKMLQKLPEEERENLFVVFLTAGEGGETGADASSKEALDSLGDMGVSLQRIRLSRSETAEAERGWTVSRNVAGEELEQALDAVYGAAAAQGEVRMVLDPRFRLTEGEKERLAERKTAVYEEREDGTTLIRYSLSLPEKEEKAWKESLLVEAREAFIGGNEISVLGEGSGVVAGGELVSPYPLPQVNVPIRFHVGSAQADIVSGQNVPLETERGRIVDEMYLPDASVFCGMEETGEFRYLWLDEAGNQIGSSEELGRITPETNRVFTLEILFVPSQDGLDLPPEAGSPADAVSRKGCYAVNVRPDTAEERSGAP